MSEITQVTLPASVALVAAATAAATLVMYDEQVAFPGGRLSAMAGNNRIRLVVRHDEDVSFRLDFKLTAAAAYTNGTPVVITTAATAITSTFDEAVEGFPFFRLVAIIGATNQGVWVPALNPVSERSAA